MPAFWNKSLNLTLPTFIGFLPEDRCYEYKLTDNRIDLNFGATEQTLRKVGTINFVGRESYSWVEAVRIYLTDQEDVFHDCPSHACEKPWLLGPMVKISERSGFFTPEGGGPVKPLMITFSPLSVGDTYVKFSGNVGDRIISNLEWSQP